MYAAALDAGDYTPATIVNDAPEVYDLWKPQNYKKGAFQGPVRLRHALAKSINTVAIRVLNDVGVDRVVELARRFGIASELPESLSLALGSGEVTPLEMTNAFATFAAEGRYAPPVMISHLNGRAIPPTDPVEVLRPEVAFLTLSMMQSVVSEGTATRARKLKMAVAGKTGTSNDSRDAWFVGMTTDYVVGVWVGFDNNASLGRGEGGGKTALPAFVQLISKLEPGGRVFRRPTGVVTAALIKKRGYLRRKGPVAVMRTMNSSSTERFLRKLPLPPAKTMRPRLSPVNTTMRRKNPHRRMHPVRMSINHAIPRDASAYSSPYCCGRGCLCSHIHSDR